MRRQTSRSVLGLGLAFALAGAGLVTTGGVAGAAPASPIQRVEIPAAPVYTVTASGDSGPGTFGDAIAQVNAGGAPATIAFTEGLAVTLTQVPELTQSLRIEGNGATVHWAAATDDGAWLHGEDVAVQVFDLTVSYEGDSWYPLIELAETPADYTTILEGVTFLNPVSGGLLIESGAGDVDITGLTATGRTSRDEPEEGAVVELWDVEGSVAVTESAFTELITTAVALSGVALTDTGQVTISGNTFTDLDVQEAEFSGQALTLENVYSETPVRGAAPAVTVTDNTFSVIRGDWVDSVVQASDISGGLELRDNEFRENTTSGSTLGVEFAEGSFGEGYTVVLAGNAFSENVAEEAIVSVDDVPGAVLVDATTVRTSAANGAGLDFGGISPESPLALPALTVRDTRVDWLSGTTDAESPDAGLRVTGTEGSVVIEGSQFSHVAAETAAVLLTETSGGILIDGSTVSENTPGGVVIEESSLADDQQLRVVGTVFGQNVANSTEAGAGLTVDASGADTRTQPLVEVLNSSFLENEGGGAAGAWIATSTGEDYAAPDTVIASSTFWNPRAGADGLASDLVLAPADAARDGAPQAVIRNTTVERRDAAQPGLPAILGQTENMSVELEHVSMPGGSYAQACTADGAGAVSVHNSALGSATAPAIDAGEHCVPQGSGNTVAVAGDIPAAVADVLPVDAWLLGDLADNGGPTQTLLPGAESPLIDSTENHSVEVDQRGVSRPQGVATDRGAVEVEAPVVELGELELGPDVAVVAGEPAALTVTRAGDPAAAATVTVELRDGTAVAGTDYTAERFELSWAAGDAASQEITVATLESVPGTRALTAALVSPTGATIGARGEATVTITQKQPVIPPTPVDPVDPTDPVIPVTPQPTLPVTGGETGPVLLFGALLLGVGAAVLGARRLRGARRA